MTTNRIDYDLSELLQTMALHEKPSGNDPVQGRYPPDIDASMVEDPNYLSDATSESSNLSVGSKRAETYGCAYLQTIRSQLDNYATTGGEYLEAIFTHREILAAFPYGHQECARGLSDIAYMLEQRAWRADRDADTEAVIAFRHEAWMIAASMPPNPTSNLPRETDRGRASFACSMAPM